MYLMNNLGFDRFSLWKLANTSDIGIFDFKAKGNSKPTVCLEIHNILLLNNYLIPFLSNFTFLSKKGLDFADFKKVAMMIVAKEHITIKGLNRILEIKLNMNKHREW